MIRKALTTLGVATASGLLMLGAAGIASAAPDVSAVCAANQDFGTSHGGCVSFFQNGNLDAVIADLCKDANVQQIVGTDNHGQCVKAVKALFS